ncbi:MAG: HPP family protein [Coriobacteriales bacterium]|jgi:CBS-domain-containing membrane protein|nr:HPP family protein [Coriobacteriales bacterium]
MLRIQDSCFKQLRWYFLAQSGAAMLIVILLMSLASIIDSEVVVASIGASVFIAMSMPQAKTSRARYFIGGYACGILAGAAGFALMTAVPFMPHALVAGLAVGLAVMLMVCLNCEHPPAAALALGLVLTPHTLAAMAIALGFVTLLSLALHFLRPWMRNLL